MPTINLGGNIGGAGGGSPGPGGLNKLWEQLLANPSMATQRQFLTQLNQLLPNNLFHSGGAAGVIQAMSRLISSVGGSAGAAAGAGPQGAAGAARAAAQVATAAARVAAAAAMTSAGGGRGGASGGGGGGFGTGRGWPGPIRRSLHFGGGIGELAGLAGLGRLAGILGGGAALAAGAYEAVRLPTQIGGFESSSMAEARPYTRLKRELFRIARASGSSGGAMMRRFFPGEDWGHSYQAPEWMSHLGLSPDDAAAILGRYGIVPRGAGEAQQFVRSLRLGQISPAFAGMAPGTVEGLARQGQALGIGNRARPDYLLAKIAPVMEQAIAKGMDRAAVLRSIQGTLARLGGTSFGIGLSPTLDFYQKLSASNLPGARTGQLQQKAISGIEGSIQSLGSSPITTMNMARAIAAHGNFATGHDIAKALPHAYAQLKKTAAGRKLLGDVESLHGNVGAQIALLKSVFSGDPAEYAHLMQSGMPKGVFGGGRQGAALRRLALSNVTGEGVAAYYGLHSGSGMPSDVMGSADNGFLGYFGMGHFGAHRNYAKLLAGKGMPKQLMAGIISAAKRSGVSPLRLAALSKFESGFDVNATHKNKNGTEDLGAFQLNSGWLKSHGIPRQWAFDPSKAPRLALLHMRESVMHGQGPIEGYNPGAAKHELAGVRDAYLSMFGGMPNDVYAAHAAAGQAGTTGAMTSFEVFGKNLGKVNNELSKFAGFLHSIVGGKAARPTQMPQQGSPM
jgi:hypothetical protein